MQLFYAHAMSACVCHECLCLGREYKGHCGRCPSSYNLLPRYSMSSRNVLSSLYIEARSFNLVHFPHLGGSLQYGQFLHPSQIDMKARHAHAHAANVSIWSIFSTSSLSMSTLQHAIGCTPMQVLSLSG